MITMPWRHVLLEEFMIEGLNEHQKMLRMRGRPKILLAKSYDEAICFYEKYKNNMLGIITDMSYLKDGKTDPQAGVKLCEKVRQDDEFLPILIQSSDLENEEIARKLKVKFLYKNSKTLSLELRDFINEYMVFGDFIFRDPVTYEEISRAQDLQSLQLKIFEIPDDSLTYHLREIIFRNG